MSALRFVGYRGGRGSFTRVSSAVQRALRVDVQKARDLVGSGRPFALADVSPWMDREGLMRAVETIRAAGGRVE